jgi:hypothetical protein
MKKIIKKLGVALAFVPMFALLIGGAISLPAHAAPVNSNDSSCENMSGLGAGANCGKNNSTPTGLFTQGGIFNTVINVMLFIVGVLSVIMIIYAGIRYVSSRGESAQVTGAKNTIMYAIIGLVISIFAYAIVNWVIFAATNTTN